MSINVMITDDHPLVAQGLQQLLQPCRHIKVIHTFKSGQTLLNGLKKSVPDVLLLDYQLSDHTANELVPQILKSYPGLRILILSSTESAFYVKSMMQLGCMGYLLKSTADDKMLIKAIETVHNGQIFLDAALKENMLLGMLKPKQQLNAAQPILTLREKEILQLIVEEYRNQEIADKLFLSLRTIEAHRYNLLQKLKVKNTVGLVKMAIQMGLVE